MNKEYQLRKNLNRTFFLIYVVVLINLIFFKGPIFYKVVLPYDVFNHSGGATSNGYNLVPLRTIKMYISGTTWTPPDTKFINVFGNMALFVPFGFLLPLVFNRMKKFRYTFLVSFFLSCFFEIVQLLTHTGFCDVDDVLLNAVGGAVGYLFFAVIYG